MQFRAKCWKKNVPKPAESYTNPTSYTLSYTQSYTRNCQQIRKIWGLGVGNVGDFQKTFFMGGRKNVETASTRRRTGIPIHRTSLGKSTEVLHQKYGGFMQRSPMFLFFRRMKSNVRILPPQKYFLLKSPTFPTPGKENPNKSWPFRVNDWV